VLRGGGKGRARGLRTGVASAAVVFFFLAGLSFTGAIINGPNFHSKFALEAPTIDYRRPAASHVDWPSRTLLTFRPARQDAVLLRRMITTALGVASCRVKSQG